jgi:uncharacterized membrane protein YgaE (UPF0421/DUF939 family)
MGSRVKVVASVPHWVRAVVGRLHIPAVNMALKAAVAAGVAYQSGLWLPGQLSDYAYYAAYSAVIVLYPTVSDSLKEAARTVLAIMMGVAIALIVQWAARQSAVTVALVVLVGGAFSGLRLLGRQRSWVTFAALFVLTVGGANPNHYAFGYVSQILLGAIIGVSVNYILVAPLSLYDFRGDVARLRHVLVARLRHLSELLREPPEDDLDWASELEDLGEPAARLRSTVAQASRARRWNPRARRRVAEHEALFEKAQTLDRLTLSVRNITMAMEDAQRRDDRQPVLGAREQQAVAEALDALADVLDDPEDSFPTSARAVRADATAQHLLEVVNEAEYFTTEDRFFAANIAIATRRCLRTFSRSNFVPDATEGTD